MTSARPRSDVLGLLVDCRREAGEPRMGTREVEIARLCGGRRALLEITRLRRAGLVRRGRGYAWVEESAFQRMEAA